VSAKGKVKREARGPLVEILGRFGLVAMGISFGIVGVLAILLALGRGGKATDREGALATIAGHPLGKILLIVLAAGFAGYALWRYAEAIFDRQREGEDPSGLGKRAAAFAKGLLYTGLLAETLGILFGLDESSGSKRERGITAWLLRHSGGKWVVAAIGLAVFAAGIWNLFRAVTGRFTKHLKEHEMPDAAEGWAIPFAVFGYCARAVVFCLIGVFVVNAAWDSKPRDAFGLDGALRKVANAPAGPWLLGVVAAGLIAYGLYCFVQARYREV
jgi:hypothetical protein